MHKRISILSIIFLLLSQFMTSASVAFAQGGQPSFKMEAKSEATSDKAEIEIRNVSSVEFDSIEIELPTVVAYNEITEKINQTDAKVNYDQQNHKIIFEWDEVTAQKGLFILKDLRDEIIEFSVKGIIDNKVVSQENHKIYLSKIEVETTEEPIDNTEEADSSKEPKVDDEDAESQEEAKSDAETVESSEEPKGDSEKVESEKAAKDNSESEQSTEDSADKTKSEPTSKITEKKTDITPMDESSTLGDLNQYIGIGPVFDTALTGADANFRLTLKLSGAKRIYKNVDVVIDLPNQEYITFNSEQENLDQLAIDGVSATFNQETNQLTYHFAEMKRGQMYEKIISLNTQNGYIANNTDVSISAAISGEVHYTENDEKEEASKGDIVPFEYEDNATMKLQASGALSLSKSQVNESGDTLNDSSLISRGEDVYWKLKLEIPKKTRGQLYLNPDEKIVVTDTLPPQLLYKSVIEGVDASSVDGQTITWEFDVEDLEQQDEKGKMLYEKEIIILTQVKNNAAEGEITNQAKASAVFIENEQVEDEANRSAIIATGNPSTGEIQGTVYVPNHFGPGGINDNKNPRPTVKDDELLEFRHGIAPLDESFPDKKGTNLGKAKNFQEYQTIYEIDPNLNLETMRAPGKFQFRPNAAHPAGEYFAVQPQYAIKAKINGSNSYETLVPTDKVVQGKTYTREELGLQPGDKVNEIRIEFVKGYNGNANEVAPGGMLAGILPTYEFSIEEGFTGTVENKFNITGMNGNGERFNDRNKNPDRYDNNSSGDISGPRQAIVVGYGQNPTPIGKVAVKLLEDVRGVVTQGSNRMQVELSNVNNSPAPMNEQLETVVLLPPGVVLADEVNPSYTDGQGNSTNAASYEVLEDDYNGSGRQLIKVKWDDSRITKGQQLLAELDVRIKEEAPNQLVFDVYGFSSDQGLTAPSSTDGGITDTVLQTDTEDLNGNGNTDQPRLKSGNIYTLAGKYDVQTEKLIKGPNDDEYSKFTLAPFEGVVDYKLKLTNTTGKNLSIMTLIDVLPTVGDLGITDNINRGSTFDPVLEEPITIPAEWEDKVNVYYSTAKNPERDDLTRYTDYLPDTVQLTNPEGAEDPNWMMASAVTDWSKIHSFKIELEKGKTWIKGQDIEIDFSMKMPKQEDVSDEAKNLDLVPQQRAAWNSFAVATDTGQPVEPERVGVALDLPPPTTPDVEKEVEDNNGDYGKELVEKEREKDYNYRVSTVVPEDLAGFEYITLADELDDRLEVKGAVALVDGEAVDYEVVIEDQLVTLKVDREQLDQIAGQTLTLQITAQIKAGVKVEVIDNDATIQVNNNPTKESNVVPVIPPPITPDIEKEVEDNNGDYGKELVEKEREKDYNYRVNTVVPEDLAGFEYITLADELDDRLEVQGAVALVDGEAVDYEVVIEDQLVTLKVDREQLDQIAGQTLTLQITAQIKAGVKVEVIDNDATIQVNNNPTKESNVVPVIPPPITPDIEKEVEDNNGDYGKELVEKEREKDYNYRVNTVVPTDLAGFEHIILADELDDRLDVQGAIALVDGEAVDYEVVIEDQLVTLKVDREQLNEIAGQTLTLQITAQIKAGVKVEVIDNQANIQVNNNPKKDSNVVPVIPPPITPDIEKEVEDNNGDYGKELVEKEREKDYNYRVNTVVPEDLAGFEYITLADELDDRLDVQGAVALVDGEAVDYEVVIEDQLVTLKVDREQLDQIAGQTLTLQITAQIKAGVKVEVIDNQANIQVNNNPKKDSNVVPVIPPPETVPKIDKNVEGKEHLDIDYNKEYKYNVIAQLPSNIEDYEHFVVTDKVDEGLVVNKDKVMVTVDGQPYDGLKLTVKGNDVKVEVMNFAGLKNKKNIELVITAKIHQDTNINNYKDNKIPNTADLEFTNESGTNGKITTDPVTVTPKPIVPPALEEPPVKEGSLLPVTNTNTFNVMLVGFILILTGLLITLVSRRKVEKDS